MLNFKKFEFERSKGIIWVCDIAHSSKYLNDNETVDDIEEYLPRLYWTSSILIEAFGGKFIKWTGDGFMAWFETPLDRNKQEISELVFHAAWHLSFLNNITQLDVNPKTKFKLRHGITYEKDALLLKIHEPNDNISLDIIGRSVVLAFRLSGIKTEFPCIAAEKEIANSISNIVNFKKWNPTEEDKLKYFKGENFGTKSIFVSTSKKYGKPIKLSTLKKKADKVIEEAVGTQKESATLNHINKFIELMESGPAWCKKVIEIESKFIKEELLESLKSLSKLIENKKE